MSSLISLIVLMNIFLIRCILSFWHRIISILSLGVIIFFYWKRSIYILRSLVKGVFILWCWSRRTLSRKIFVALYLLMWILHRVCLFLWGYISIWCIIIFIDIFKVYSFYKINYLTTNYSLKWFLFIIILLLKAYTQKLVNIWRW